MAYNKRGRIKERLEGIHKNCDWIIEHVEQCLQLIEGSHENLSGAFKGIGEVAEQLDKLSQNIYHTI